MRQRYGLRLAAALRLAALALLGAAFTFVASQGRANLPRGVGRGRNASRGPQCTVRKALALSRFSTGEQLLEKLDKERTLAPLEELGLEVGMPDVNDLPEITALMVECFDRTLKKKRWDEGNPLAQYVNPFIEQNEVKEIAKGIQMRLDVTLQFPSLRRPIKQDESIALVARQSKGGPLIAYVEICLLPADGRRPEDERPMDGATPWQPYLSNLCVTQRARRSGIGRALLALMEEVIRYVWKDQRIYLHIDNYGPAKALYESEGFVATGPMDAEDVTHMMKELPPVEEELDDDDEDEEAPDEDEEDEDEESTVKALPSAE